MDARVCQGKAIPVAVYKGAVLSIVTGRSKPSWHRLTQTPQGHEFSVVVYNVEKGLDPSFQTGVGDMAVQLENEEWFCRPWPA
jgi:hypothetical protein